MIFGVSETHSGKCLDNFSIYIRQRRVVNDIDCTRKGSFMYTTVWQLRAKNSRSRCFEDLFWGKTLAINYNEFEKILSDA